MRCAHQKDFKALVLASTVRFTLYAKVKIIHNFRVFSDAPVYLSFPHFLDADPSLNESVDGLNPDREKHQSYFKIQPVRYDFTLIWII